MRTIGSLVILIALSAGGGAAQKPAACCSITAIEKATGLVSAKVAANNQVFQFKVTNARTLSTLRVGQGVFANFTTQQVSIDGRTACCAISSGPTAPTVAPAPGALTSVKAALQTALGRPDVRASVTAEVLRQLRMSRPLAFVNGYWVSPIDLTGVYRLSVVRTGLLSSLGPSGPQLIGAASNGPDDIALVFTPSQMAKLFFGDMERDLTASVGREALQNTMSGLVGVDDVVIVGALMGAAVVGTMFLMEWVHHHTESGDAAPAPPTVDTGTGDMDNDGLPDYADDDNDGDGTVDAKDSYPNDASKQICDCGRVRGMVFARSVKGDLLVSLGAALAAVRAPQAARISLGSVRTGLAGAIAIVF